MARVKYMGKSHVRRFEKGEDWGGRLEQPLDQDIEFNLASGHVADLSEVPDYIVALILEDPEFKDVSDYQVAPTGQAEQLYNGVQQSTGYLKDGSKAPAADAPSEAAPADDNSANPAFNPTVADTANLPPVDPNATVTSEAKASAAATSAADPNAEAKAGSAEVKASTKKQ